MEMAGCSGTDGIDELHRAIRHWYVPVLGLGWGSTIGLWHTEVIVLAVFLFQVLFSRLWLSGFKFGPLEWIWRMLTYGKWLEIRLSFVAFKK